MKKINITHIKQLHDNPISEMTPSETEKVAFSQFNVAKAILKKYKPQETIILLEGEVEDLLQETQRSEWVIKEEASRIKQIFPSGLPDQFSSLTSLQKETLVKIDSTKILYYLGEITDIYKTANKNEQKESVRCVQKMQHLNIEYKDDFSHLNWHPRMQAEAVYARNQRYYDYMWCVWKPREWLAIRYAKEAAIKTNKSEVLIIFGGVHNFNECIDLMKDPDISLSSAIETTPEEPPSLMDWYLARIPMTISGIRPLDDIIMGSCIVYFIQAKLTTLSEIIEIYNNNRSAITLMRLPNFIEAIEEKLISVKQVVGLTKEQIESLIEEKRIKNTKDQIVKLFENYDVFGWRNHRARSRAVTDEIKKAKDHKEVGSILDAQLGVFEGGFHPGFLRTDAFTQRWVLPLALRNKRKGEYHRTVQEAVELLKTPTNS